MRTWNAVPCFLPALLALLVTGIRTVRAESIAALSLQSSTPQVSPISAADLVSKTQPDESERRYADTFIPLRDDVRTFERDPDHRYAYCIRNVGTYECLSYAEDGTIRHKQYQTTAHGTGFAYQQEGEATRLLTNEHVIAWPPVTDAEHRLDDVPLGCKLLTQALSIVDNEEDDYDGDDIVLKRVIEDRALDAAVVQAKAKLRIMPYRIGRSSSLSSGDVVIVRGFPLGVFQAYNTGKIINTYDHDVFKQWDHTDFIIDAQLSNGNSGSPVLALNRSSGEYELVGIFHASYTRANALNAVIGIDQLTDFMLHLQLPTQRRGTIDLEQLPFAEQRLRIHKALAERDFVPFVAMGPLMVAMHTVGDRILFEVFSSKFPQDDHRLAFLLDSADVAGWGKLSRVWFGSPHGYRGYGPGELDGEASGQLKRVLQRLHAIATTTLSYRQSNSRSGEGRQSSEQRAALQRVMKRAAQLDPDLAQQLVELAEKRASTDSAPLISAAEVLEQLTPAALTGPVMDAALTQPPVSPRSISSGRVVNRSGPPVPPLRFLEDAELGHF